jgi:16S rRNA processing protein RimM
VTGSPDGWVLLAHIVRPQGRHGEVLADIFTDFPDCFSQRKGLLLRSPAGVRREAKVESHWLHKGRVVLKFAQVDSIPDAENLRGFDVVVAREQRMPLDGEELLIPFVRAYLRKMDIAAKRLEMDLPAGLLTMQGPLENESD